jgi:hypothetical protein
MRFEVTVIRPSRPSKVAAMHIAAAREFMSRLRNEDALAKIQAASQCQLVRLKQPPRI